MKFIKKLFKHGGSKAMVIPSEIIKHFPTENVVIQFTINKENQPMIIITPSEKQETIENDPLFGVFLKALYKNAMENPEKLYDLSEIFDEEADELLEGVDIHAD